ncbi:glycosyltransferase family 39 protein [bacterium]|nr:glycosyltransferase family 39 protein [bacterium]
MQKILEYLKNNYIDVIMVTIITIFALIIRLITLQNFGDLWLDELYSLSFATYGNIFETITELIRQDVHQPLYFVILNIFLKIFGANTISVHACSIILAIPLIPLSFYFMKNLFNRFTGYVAAILFAINTFCAYYSVEVRFYSLVLPLTFLSAVFFVKMLTDSKENINRICFIIFQILLIYTFTIAPLLSFFYFIVGFVYLKKYNANILKKYLMTFLYIFLLAIPAILILIYNFIATQTSLVPFQNVIYVFNWKIIFDILENYFSTENFQIVSMAMNYYNHMFDGLKNWIYILYVLVPIIIGLIGFTKSMLSKDKKLYLFVIPSILYLLTACLFANLGVILFLTRYSIIVYPMIVCAAWYGLSLIKYRNIGFFLIVCLILLNYFYLLIHPYNVLNLHRVDSGYMPKVLSQLNIKKDDLFLVPYSGKRLKAYIRRDNLIDFTADDMLLMKDKKSKIFYFGENFDKINKKNVSDLIYGYIKNDKVMESYEDNLCKFYINNMKKGQKLIFIIYRYGMVQGDLLNHWDLLKNRTIYSNSNIFFTIMTKISYDSIKIAEKHLKYVNRYVCRNNQGYPLFAVYVYEKQ